ncbi:asparagine synthase C-terminal domain-containing protein [Nocardia ignorata]|uniref:Asparagine synthase n=1 Tax=Nocardia ignorata TaxID=145285 RepID=A0A4R6PIJ2_NOCIG|nr:asparagine synthase C-terminal domain-containing protein [Nocardia ignorata]TDP37665.1 asparagine synthase [Nocardia ignorata]
MKNYPSVSLEGWITPFGLAFADAADAGRLTVEEYGREWPLPAGGPDSCGTIEWSNDAVVVRTNRLNPTTLYYWVHPDSDRFLIGTDRAGLLARIVAATGSHTDHPPYPIGAGRTVTFSTTHGGLTVEDTVTARWTSAPISGETAHEAGNRQIAALRREIAAVGGPRPITVVVSGGVDSGLVAALAEQAGIVDHLASLGTPWGDEYPEADELGAHLGVPVRRIALSEEEILRALPETVRMLGTTDRETVAAGVNLVAVYRQGTIPAGTILTGVGADLINSGNRDGSGPVADIQKAVAERLAEAAASSELTGVGAAVHGYALRHMYWNSSVVQAALDTAPEVMRYRDREKGHMRLAAEQLVPDSVAWRPKQALHHGSGVERNLDAAVARLIGVEQVDAERFYRLIEAQLVEALLKSPDGPIHSDDCLKAAISAYLIENQ